MKRLPKYTAIAVVILSLTTAVARAADGGGVALINLQVAESKSIAEAARKMGVASIARARQNEALPDGTRLVVFYSRRDLADDDVKKLAESVQHGTSLLVVLGDHAGRDAYVMSSMLPTTAWDFQRSHKGPFTAAEFDPEIFGSDDLKGLSIPYLHEIRPFDAVERGQARYDELDHSKLFTGSPPFAFIAPGSNAWTRPLLNHDWRIRARATGDLALPLLITGRFGLGRVAVFAAGPDALDGSPQGAIFWNDTLKWLLSTPTATVPPADAEALSKPTVTIDAEHRAINIKVTNSSSAPASALVIAREMTWEPAIIRDVEKPITVPANGEASVAIPLPEKTDTSYAAVAEHDSYDVRLGILSEDGSILLNESRFHADATPPMLVTLDSDDVRTYAWPFAPADHLEKENRMGERMDEYAYKPGEVVHAQLTFDNGTRNIAYLAKPHDETTPDNPSTSALNHGFAMSELKPDVSLNAFGTWHGVDKSDNIVTLTFPEPVLINAINLIGTPTDYRRQDLRNPSAVTIEIDGKEVARDTKLVDRFLAEKGNVRIPFDPVRGSVVRLTLPWQDGLHREEPTIGDIQVWGTQATDLPPDAHGTAALSLYDCSSDQTIDVGTQAIDVPSGGHKIISFDVPTPKTDGKPGFYRLQATFAGQSLARPFMTIEPRSVLPSMQFLRGASVDRGFLVTAGFRNIFKNGTGTSDGRGSWESPDDLVFAYEHDLKETGTRSPYSASRLYVTDNDFAHYSTPWKHFPGGDAFFDIAAPLLVTEYSKSPEWKTADTAAMGYSDRWDAGPPVLLEFSWPELIAFDQWLRTKQIGKLSGRTRQELIAEVQAHFLGAWYLYHLQNFQHSVDTMHDAFAAVGKKLLITSQGCPMLPPKYAKTISDVFRGNSDDSTWGERDDDPIATTGKQMGDVAFNPYLQMSTLAHWQFVASTLNNQFWHFPTGTTEPSRRFLFDRAFRGVIRMDGSFTSMHSFAFNSNVGDALRMTSVDYDQWKRVRDLHVLIEPEAPLGAGLVIANSYLNDPKNTRFGGTYEGTVETEAVIKTLPLLERSGVSVPFSANILALEKWQGTSPLIVLNLARFTPEELTILRKTMSRGVRVAAFCESDLPISAEAAELFGVDPSGAPAGGKKVGTIDGRPIVAKGVGLFVPTAAEGMAQSESDSIGQLIVDQLQLPIKFETGSTGYGFVSNGRQFVVLEDWREEPRTLHLRLAAGKDSSEIAIGVNDSQRLPIHKDGSDWLIDVPTRPGDGNIVCVQTN